MNGKMKRALALLLAVLICMTTAITAFAISETEDNDSIADADVISVNETVYGSSVYDHDYFKFTVPSRGYVQIVINKEYDNSYMSSLLKYDGAETEELMYGKLSSGKERVTWPKLGLDAGTYYLFINSGRPYDGGDYNFVVNFVDTTAWETEDNDSIVDADKININETVYGYNGFGQDYFKFEIPSDGYVQIEFNKDYDSSFSSVNLLTYDGEDTKTIDSMYAKSRSEKVKTDKLNLTGGTYFINVSRTNGDLGSGYYNFKVNFSTQPPSGGGSNSGGSNSSGGSNGGHSSGNYNPPQNNSNNSGSVNSTPQAENTTEFIWGSEPDDIYIYNYFQYTIYNSTVIICGYTGTDVYVSIPDEIEGMSVTGIAENTFAGTAAQRIEVPTSVTNFGKNAFGNEDGEQRTIIAEEGSPAQKYAEEKNIEFERSYGSKSLDVKKIVVIAAICVAGVAIVGATVYLIYSTVKKRSEG